MCASCVVSHLLNATHIAYGDRCEGQKKHTDYADDTDWSFHGFFLTRYFIAW